MAQRGALLVAPSCSRWRKSLTFTTNPSVSYSSSCRRSSWALHHSMICSTRANGPPTEPLAGLTPARSEGIPHDYAPAGHQWLLRNGRKIGVVAQRRFSDRAISDCLRQRCGDGEGAFARCFCNSLTRLRSALVIYTSPRTSKRFGGRCRSLRKRKGRPRTVRMLCVMSSPVSPSPRVAPAPTDRPHTLPLRKRRQFCVRRQTPPSPRQANGERGRRIPQFRLAVSVFDGEHGRIVANMAKPFDRLTAYLLRWTVGG
jgi:hypothetical protein